MNTTELLSYINNSYNQKLCELETIYNNCVDEITNSNIDDNMKITKFQLLQASKELILSTLQKHKDLLCSTVETKSKILTMLPNKKELILNQIYSQLNVDLTLIF